ncbi:hypothetical protein PARHAE_00814 [Paracoccus haematequi]|uniref:Uncharacterized protein n=1 Tax=Paracoccus haematequi TaxID=2491866 RepID=A0A447IJH7_9RHOB|nr:hypothetical protein PARHAE_00814 [Paracoccus haematequi]
MTLEYANEYPDILSRPTGGLVPSDRPLVRGAALTERDGKPDFVCGGAFLQDPATVSLDDCERV